ncbi:MAG: electron transport complex subunit E [Firmicutes bacterium]|nr:electron transport complex subunit E [Bacillota bacterium]
MSIMKEFTKGFVRENPTFRIVLGTCPTLAVTTLAANGLGMGLSTTAVLVASNLFISLLRKAIPDKIRIPAYIIIIATFVTIVDMVLNAFTPDLHSRLGIFIPLIVVNCIILGRAEAFANKNGVVASLADGLGMGLGFTLSLTILGSLRELLSAGTLFGKNVMGAGYEPFMVFGMPTGGFLAYGLVMALLNYVFKKLKLE